MNIADTSYGWHPDFLYTVEYEFGGRWGIPCKIENQLYLKCMNHVIYFDFSVAIILLSQQTFTKYFKSPQIMKKDKNSLTDLIDQSNGAIRSNASAKNNHTAPTELEKSKVHIIVEIIEYMPNAVVSKTIIKKTTGNVTITSFDTGEELAEKTSPFDTYIQVIAGAAEIIIDEKKYLLRLGNGVVIPAHAPHCINAKERFKMISTVIKSGYED